MKDKLGEILWERIETAEGYSYISDAVAFMPDKEVIVVARAALYFALKVVDILKAFIKEYGE